MIRVIALAILVGCLASGCGPAGSPFDTAHVSGRVTLDGQPLESGTLNLVPLAGGQARPNSAEISSGEYAISEAPLGKVRAYITSTKETGRMVTGSSEPVPEVKNVIPAKYVQGIEVEISGDTDRLDFELTSDGEIKP